MKSAQRRRRLRGLVSLEERLERGGPAEADQADLRAPNDLAAFLAERDVVGQVLGDLTPALREALLLNALAGLSAAEVALVLGISSVAAERRISRAKEAFRVRYTELTKENS